MAHVSTARTAAALIGMSLGWALLTPPAISREPEDELVFEANRGQMDAPAAFLARAGEYQVLLGPEGVSLRLPGPPARHDERLELLFLGAVPAVPLAGTGARPERVHYLGGTDPDAAIVNVPTFTGIASTDPYPGIALAYRSEGRRLAIELTFAPGADPSALRLGFRGAHATRLDPATGALVAVLAGGEIRFEVQESQASFVMRGNEEVGLILSSPDRETARSVRIVAAGSSSTDPTGRFDAPRIATDTDGNAYVAGRQRLYPGERMGAFVAKVASDGRTRLSTTYFETTGADVPEAIAVDGRGQAVVVGRTNARGFILKLTADGSAVVFSRELAAGVEALAVALDASGSAWVAGRSSTPTSRVLLARFGSDGSPLEAPASLASLEADAATAIAIDVEGVLYLAGPRRSGAPFIAKLDPTGNAVRYSIGLPAPGRASVTDLAIDRSGLLHVAGNAPSGRFTATLAGSDGTLQREGRYSGPVHANAAGFAPDGEGGAWLAGGGDLALRLDSDDRIIERLAVGQEDVAVTGIASGVDETAFVTGVSGGGTPSGFLVLATSDSGGTLFVGLVPSSPAVPAAAGCPGTIQFTNGGATGLWQTPTNWNLGHVPLVGDDVCIPAGFAVTLSSTQSVNSVFVAATSSLTVAASLTVATASQFDGPLTLQASGTLTGSGDVTCTGTFNWTGGTIAGAANFFANGGMAVSGANAKDLTSSRVLDVSGTTTWTGTGSIRLGSSASIVNHGTWDCQNNASIANLGSASGFTNLAGATFKKTVATGTTTIVIPFINAGTTSIQTGLLSLNAGGTQSGSVTGSAGTTLSFGGGTHTLNTGSNVNVPTVIFDAGTVNLDGSYTATTGTTISGATANFNLAGTVTSIGPTLTLSSGTANFASGESIAPATLAMSFGTLQGTDTISISGLFTWTGGTMTGSGSTQANGGMAVSAAAAKDLTGSRVLTVQGTTTTVGTGSIRIGSGATIVNNGLWDCQSDASIANLGSAGTFTNALGATFRKSSGAGATTVSVPFANTGTVSVLSGTISLNGGGTHAGSFTGSPGTVLQFGGGTHTVASTSSLAAASVVFDAGTIHFDGTYAAVTGTTVSGATVNFNPASTLSSIGTALTLSSGTANFSSGDAVNATTLSFVSGTRQGTDTVNVSGLITWSAGTMSGAGITNANGGLAIGGAAAHDVAQSHSLRVAGATWTGSGGLRLGAGATVTNSGVWDCQNDGTIGNLGSAAGFTNLLGATFRKSAGAGTTTINVPIVNAGTISLLSGSLNLSDDGTHSGAVTGAASTVLRFGGGTHTLGAGSSIAAATVVFDAGTVHIDAPYAASIATTINGGVVNFNPAATVTSVGDTLTIAGGTTTFSSGEPITATTLSFSSGTRQGSDTISVSGLTAWTGGTMTGPGTTNANGGIDFSGAATRDVLAAHTLNVAGATTWTGGGMIRLGGAATITNTGTWDCQGNGVLANFGSAGPFTNGAAGVFKKSAGTATGVQVAFVNAGAVQALTSALQFSGGYTQASGSTSLSGGTISSTTPMNIQTGTVTGTGTATASVVNAGHAVPGSSIGILSLTGNYTQTVAGSLDAQLGGRIAGTEYDQLNLTGAASFSGALNVTLANGFVPVGGDSFTLMNYASSTGAFSASSLPPLAQGCWRTFYEPTSLVLQVWTVAPETTGLGAAADKSTVTWNALPPAAGPSPTYDLMRGVLGQFPVGGKPSETCIASGVSATNASDVTVPAVGTGFYYLVRGSNVCGVGGYGTASNGTPRMPTVCP